MRYTIKVTRIVFAEDEARAIFSFRDAMNHGDFTLEDIEVIKTEDEDAPEEITPSDDEVKEYMELHNNDEVGQGDNAWDFEEAKRQLLLDDKYYYLNNPEKKDKDSA